MVRKGATYGGKSFEQSGAKAWELTDQQKKFLTEDHLRHVLVMLLRTSPWIWSPMWIPREMPMILASV